MKWRCESGGDKPTIVYPLDDLKDHVTDGSPCWCNPEIDKYGVVVYNSMDGREQFETGERKPS